MTLKQREIEEQLRRFLVGDLIEDFYGQPYDGDDPLADGVIDSLGVEQLIEHVNASFGIALGEDDVVAENFESLPALAELVESKVQG
jgi:acyl carrier protein